MRVTDDYFCTFACSFPSAVADIPADQKDIGQPSTALALAHPPLPHNGERGRLLETLKVRANKLGEVADHLLVVVNKTRSMGWSLRGHYMRPVYAQNLKKWRQAKVQAANAALAVQEVEDPVDPSWESRLRFAFLPWCKDNEGGLHNLHHENHQARERRTYARMCRIYAPGRWAAAPGDEITNTSWYLCKAPWEQELEEAKAKEEKTKQPVNHPTSPISIDPSSRPRPSPASARAPASLSSPKRRRDDDNTNNECPSSSKRPHLIESLPISPPQPAPAALPVVITSPPRPVASVSSSTARAASVLPPSASPWVIARQNCSREDENEDAIQRSNKPKRIRPSTPRQLRASSAPPVLIPSHRPPSPSAVSPLSSRARCSSVPPPTTSPRVIAGSKRRRDDSDEGTRQAVTPKRVLLSMPRSQRAGSAPPVVVASSSNSSCSVAGSSTLTTSNSWIRRSTAAPGPSNHHAPPSPSSLPSDSVSDSPSASAPLAGHSDNTTAVTSAGANG